MPLSTVGGDVNWCSHYGKRYGGFLKLEQPYSPAIPLLGICPEEMERLTRKHICSSMFIAALFTIPKTGSLPRCPSMDE